MAKRGSKPGNFVSEWFGHRVYPIATGAVNATADQTAERCPFLSAATGQDRKCIKNEKSRGVCSVSCESNGLRQDWLVCPYRALNPDIVHGAIRRLFGLPENITPFVVPAINLSSENVRSDVLIRLSRGESVFTYFDEKTGGELSIPATERSPEFAFDVTIIEIMQDPRGVPLIGRFGILEIQTTDFHGSYQYAVRNLKDVLRLHKSDFATAIQINDGKWLSEKVEGPNIANVFKRTFYQMMFKFQLGQHDRCVGCVLAIPQSVWDSWQRHLGGATLTPEADGTHSLLIPDQKRTDRPPAWVFVFDTDASSAVTPSSVAIKKMIATDAASFSYWALDVAPNAAISNIDAKTGFLAGLSRRLREWWPELAKTASASLVVSPISGEGQGEPVPLSKIEQAMPYREPSRDAVKGDTPDGS